MRLVVCVVPVLDVTKNIKISTDLSGFIPENIILNPWDEFAIEASLQMKDTIGAEVIALSVGDLINEVALRAALAMGCDQAIRVACDAQELSPLQVSKILAGAINKIGNIDLALFGKQSLDFENGVTAVQTARILKWPLLSRVSKFELVDEGKIEVSRSITKGKQKVVSNLPAVITINKDFAEPRFPSFLGSRKASKAVIPTWTTEELNINYEQVTKPRKQYEILSPREINFEMIIGESPDDQINKLIGKLKEVGL
jgi:electron transfer flavoprotein beta subunit